MSSCTSHYAYFYVRSVESAAPGPLLFSMALPIVNNINKKGRAHLLIHEDASDKKAMIMKGYDMSYSEMFSIKASRWLIIFNLCLEPNHYIKHFS